VLRVCEPNAGCSGVWHPGKRGAEPFYARRVRPAGVRTLPVVNMRPRYALALCVHVSASVEHLLDCEDSRIRPAGPSRPDATDLPKSFERLGFRPSGALQRIWITTSKATSLVQRATDCQTATVQDVRVDHRCRDVAVTQQFLDRPAVVAGLQQVRRERMAQRVAGRVLRDSGASNGIVKGSLDDGLVQI
jgi:hypothetical protein